MATTNSFYGESEAAAYIAAHEVLVAAFSTPLIFHADETGRGGVMVVLKKHGLSSSDGEKLREHLTEMFPNASDDAITRGVLCLQHRVSNFLSRLKP